MAPTREALGLRDVPSPVIVIWFFRRGGRRRAPFRRKRWLEHRGRNLPAVDATGRTGVSSRIIGKSVDSSPLRKKGV